MRLSLWLDPHKGSWLLLHAHTRAHTYTCTHMHTCFPLLRGTPLSPGGVLCSENGPHGKAKLSHHPGPCLEFCVQLPSAVPCKRGKDVLSPAEGSQWLLGFIDPFPPAVSPLEGVQFLTYCVLYPVEPALSPEAEAEAGGFIPWHPASAAFHELPAARPFTFCQSGSRLHRLLTFSHGIVRVAAVCITHTPTPSTSHSSMAAVPL